MQSCNRQPDRPPGTAHKVPAQERAQISLDQYRQGSLGVQQEANRLRATMPSTQRTPLRERLLTTGFYEPSSIDAAMAAQKAGDESWGSKLKARETITTAETNIIEKADEASRTGYQDAALMGSLGERFMSIGSDAQEGLLGRGLSAWRGVIGEQNDLDMVRTKFNGLRVKYSVKTLPPGPASDRDVQLALKGWPTEFTDRKHIYSFMMGMRKLALVDAARSAAKAEYVGTYKKNAGFTEYWDRNKERLTNAAFAVHRDLSSIRKAVIFTVKCLSQ